LRLQLSAATSQRLILSHGRLVPPVNAFIIDAFALHKQK